MSFATRRVDQRYFKVKPHSGGHSGHKPSCAEAPESSMLVHADRSVVNTKREQQMKLMKSALSSVLAVAGCLLLPCSLLAQTVGEGGGADGDGSGPSSTSSAPPAEQFAISEGGVDMRTGRYAYSKQDLTIGGGPDAGGLALARQLSTAIPGHIDAFGNLSHNWDILLTEKRIDLLNGNYDNAAGIDYRIMVHVGGRTETFDANHVNGSGFDQISKGGYARLSYTGDRAGTNAIYTLQSGDGTTITFRPIGSGDCSRLARCAYASQIRRADGTVLDLSYDSGSNAIGNPRRLRSVVNSRGYALLLEYGSTNYNHVVSACVLNTALVPRPTDDRCPATAVMIARYGYTARGLASVTDPAGATESFSYTPTADPQVFSMAFTKPGAATPWLTNLVTLSTTFEPIDQVVSHQTFADGREFSYNYEYSPANEGQEQSLAGGFYTDNLGRRVTIEYAFPLRPESPSATPRNCCNQDFQVTPGPVRIVDALGRTTTMDYCDPNAAANLPSYVRNRCLVGLLQSYTNPEGDKAEFVTDNVTRNVRQVTSRPKPGSPLGTRVTAATYDCTPATIAYCSKPTRTTDANGNSTDSVYDPVHGGVLSVTSPAVGGIRPQVRYEYVQRYAWLRSGATYARAATPVWLLAATRSCRSTAASGAGCSGGAADEVVTAYDYGPDAGPNNLWLRGMTVTADGQTLRSCYGYDDYGRQISETQPNANLATCS